MLNTDILNSGRNGNALKILSILSLISDLLRRSLLFIMSGKVCSKLFIRWEESRIFRFVSFVERQTPWLRFTSEEPFTSCDIFLKGLLWRLRLCPVCASLLSIRSLGFSSKSFTLVGDAFSDMASLTAPFVFFFVFSFPASLDGFEIMSFSTSFRVVFPESWGLRFAVWVLTIPFRSTKVVLNIKNEYFVSIIDAEFVSL